MAAMIENSMVVGATAHYDRLCEEADHYAEKEAEVFEARKFAIVKAIDNGADVSEALDYEDSSDVFLAGIATLIRQAVGFVTPPNEIGRELRRIVDAAIHRAAMSGLDAAVTKAIEDDRKDALDDFDPPDDDDDWEGDR
jgi:hypothetical protein